MSIATQTTHRKARKRSDKDATRAEQAAISPLDVKRARLIAAMSATVDRHGIEGANVTRVVATAKVPRKVFYQLFPNRDACLRASVGSALEQARLRAKQAFERHDEWDAGLRAGLDELLALFDAEPELARLCIVHSFHNESGMVALQRQVIGELAELLERGGQAPPSPISAEATIAGVLGVLRARLLDDRARRLADLSGPLMSFILLPYLGTDAATRELGYAGEDGARSTNDGRVGARRGRNLSPPMRITYRTMRALAEIGRNPGLSNSDLATSAEIADHGQACRLLKRLENLGLIENRGPGQARGEANAWHLTRRGREIEHAMLENRLAPYH
jgi:AcrR family transcriptional regulator/DNA-binding MarR family transcriptional regulator